MSRKGTPKTEVISNTIETLNRIKEDEQLLGTFNGIYLLPNICAIGRDTVVKTYKNDKVLVIVTNTNSIDINIPILFNGDVNENIYRYNSTIFNSNVLYNYYKLKYYDNDIDINYNKDEENNININGNFIFNGQGTIIKNTNYQTLEEGNLVLPANLPTTTDDYLTYVNGIKSSVNTGIRNNDINSNFGIANSVLGGISGVVGGVMSGNPFGAVSSLASSVSGGLQSGMQKQMYRDTIKAQYEDLKRTKGTNLHTANVVDTSSLLYPIEGTYKEPFQLIELDEKTLKSLNNIIYFYGNINPSLNTFEELTNRSAFNYIEFEKQ
ncbi:MAG: hypothetical protein ACRCXY_11465 [Fusobacteriaceae bacterium]